MENQTHVPYREGYTYGMGVVASTGLRASLGVIGEPSSIPGASGGSSDLLISKIETTSQLEEALGISAEASGGVGLFSASGRFDFAKSSKIQSNSLCLIVSHRLTFGYKQIDTPLLEPVRARPLADNPAGFTERYGDKFVAGMATGGLFFASIIISSSSEEARKTISASLSGSYGLAFNAKVSTNLTNAMKTSNSSANIHLYYEGGKIVNQPNPLSPEEVLAAHAEWLESIIDKTTGKETGLAVPYTVMLLPYKYADGPPTPNVEDLQHQQDVLVRCAKLRSSSMDMQNLTDYIRTHSDQFQYTSDSISADGIGKLCAKLTQDLEMISAAASHAIDHPKDAKNVEEFANTLGKMTDFKLETLPINLPKHQGASDIKVPDFSGIIGQTEAEKLCADNRLTLHVIHTGPQESWRVLSQDPPPNQLVSNGATITLIVPTLPPGNYKKFMFEPVMRLDVSRAEQLSKLISPN
jgi:hypothetical protein